MLRHTLLLIYRNFKRFKSTFFINLVGLSTGLACTMVIYMWVNDELNMDNFHEKGDRIYYAWEHRVKADGIWTSQNTPGILAETIVQDVPEVEYAAGASRSSPMTLSVGENVMKITGRFVGKDFFRIFTYPILQGDPNNVLKDRKSIVISESLAKKFFSNSKDVIGKAIEVDHRDQFVVTGVFKDIPKNSTERFEFVLPFEKIVAENEGLRTWYNTGTATYILLKQSADVDKVNEKVAKYIHGKTNNEITYRTMFLKKFTDIYLYGKYENGILVGGRITYVKLFSVIAVFILVIACINFMNLSTAKATRRIKEVGIKKAVGAGRRLLIFQYIGESLMMSFVCMAVSLLLVDLLLGKFSEITGKNLSLDFSADLFVTAVAIWLTTGIVAGSYPALYLSGFSPASVLKGKLNISLGEVWARQGLVVFQFVLSVILIVSVIIVYKQIGFLQSKNLGYDKENILYFYREGKMNDGQNLETLLSEFKRLPGVVNASTMGHDMTGHHSGTWGLVWEGKDPEDRTEFENIAVNYGMLETLGIKMAGGRMFSQASPGDTSKIIISETGIKFMGISDPIGKTVRLWDTYDLQIIGVSKDFNYESLHENFKPLFFRLASDDTYVIMVKLEAGKEKETIAAIEKIYKDLNPGFSFDYQFVDDQYQAQYIAEQRVATLSKYFAGLAILISCLGLFGLAAFTAERRLKEIGIRKVLGSSELGIVTLLSADFTKIVFVAIVIALPLSYFLTKYWLDDFAFRIELSWWYFAGAGLIALLIAWLTVGTQALRAAKVDPVKCLKDE